MPDDANSDPFRPPEIPTEVGCLHCQQVYESYLIEWRERTCADGKVRGFWCCPTPGCDGAGFGFDILPTDPEYQDEHGGWIRDDDADEDDEGLDEPGEFKEDGRYLGNMPDFESKNGDDDSDSSGDEEIPF
jgi:hypothetical protein